MRRTLTAATAAAVAAVLLACTSGGSKVETEDGAAPPAATTTAATTAAKTAKVGGNITITADGLKTTWTLLKAETRDIDQFSQKPATGGKWVLIQVKAQVLEGRDSYVCSCDLSLVTKAGRVYELGFGSFKDRPDFQTASVAPGQHTEGWINYSVPAADLPGLRVQLKQTAVLDDTAFGYWSLSL